MFERKLAFFALFCFAMVVFLAKPHETTLPATDASTHAALAMSATAQGLVPHFPIGSDQFGGHWGKGFNDHPFTFFYLNGWIMRALGPSAWSAKLLPCLLSVGCVLFTAWLGTLLAASFSFSWIYGILAGLVLCLSREFIIDGVNCHLDNVMTFFILGSFIAWEKRRFWLAGACAGLGMWFKSPVSLLLLPVAFLLEWKTERLRYKTAVAALFVGAAIWVLTGLIGGWHLVSDYWVRQLWGTAVGGRGALQETDYLQFFKILRSHYMPWTILLIFGLAWGVWKKSWREHGFRVALFAGGIVIGAISLMRFKFDHYYIPAYPFLALIAVRPVAPLFVRFEQYFYRGFSVFVFALVTLMMSTPLETAPESFPALKRFMAIIQSYGSCSDRVLYVEGYQPYGEGGDYTALINFYTGRHVIVAECKDVNRLLLDDNIGWIIVSGPHHDQCLDAAIKKRFGQKVLFGNQYLLSRVIPENELVDLTPLARELKAVKDCKAAPYPHDRYHAYTGAQ